MFDLLVGRTATACWAPADELPASFRLSERFAVLPAGRGRVFAVSLAPRRAAASALTSYNALRSPSRRLARAIVAAGLRAGLGRSVLPCRIDVGTVDTVPGEVTDPLLTEYLGGLFGAAGIVIAIGGGGGPYRKPVLQVFSSLGKPLGYVKIGWNDWASGAVGREAAALRVCAGDRTRLGVPALLGQYQWRGLDLLVTEPLPPRVRRFGAGASLPSASLLREICELSPVTDSPLGNGPWWRDVRTRISTNITDADSRAWLAGAVAALERRHGETVLRFGRWHGDLVPWNLARLGDRVYAWDWESSTACAPVGFDALHFHFQVAFVHRQRPLAEAAAVAVRLAGPALSALGLPAPVHGLLGQLHLLELCVRHEEARTCTGDRDERFWPAAPRLLGTAARSRPAAVS